VAKKGTSTRRGTINVALNGLVAAGVIAGFRTNYQTKDEPDQITEKPHIELIRRSSECLVYIGAPPGRRIGDGRCQLAFGWGLLELTCRGRVPRARPRRAEDERRYRCARR